MNKSESIKELATALSKAQAKIKPAAREGENPFFKRDGKSSTYATLAAVWDACRVPLTDNGLSVVQTLSHDLESGTSLDTILLHSSGEWILGSQPIRSAKDDPQGVKSAITYARRASLEAIAGIAPEDDDGNAASGHAVGTQAAADFVAKQKIEAFREKPDNIKAEIGERKQAALPAAPLKEGEQVIHGVLSWDGGLLKTSEKKPFAKVTVGAHTFNVFDKPMFESADGSAPPLDRFKGKMVNCKVRKKGQYLNFVAMELADIQVNPPAQADEEPPITDEDIPF